MLPKSGKRFNTIAVLLISKNTSTEKPPLQSFVLTASKAAFTASGSSEAIRIFPLSEDGLHF